ncbi:cytoplasmic protein [Coprinopsis marcescibilis]|uniref:Cytoplasmic protein n=1 Tax=Coprinopsis marcescibilis TaxID=230819 RepID=A0A5C3L8B0_COPMA|nr:cytoplasmic protein [Coprinopsis marcescibilis]
MSIPTSLDSSFIIVDSDSKEQLFEVKETEWPQNHPSSQPGYNPGSTQSYGHDWSHKGTGGGIYVHGRHFVDKYGRVCNIRGANVSGCSKTPTDHDHENFPGDHRSVTFVGRPFPLEEAHQHFSRLRRWGLTFIRFLVTWEAVEHAGPGIYDQEYLTYIRQLLSLLPKYGLTAFVSLHQDVWSRYSGGSGAPAWTLELAGFDLHAIEEAGAAWLNGIRGGGHEETERGLWPCGYQKLSAATMATLFWAGETFAPKLLVKSANGEMVSIQRFLQDHFLAMWEQIVRAVGDLEGVLGFQMMNEPHRGYIELPTLHSFDYNTDLHLGHVPSAFQSFQLGAGYPTLVPMYKRSFPWPTKLSGHLLLNSNKRKAWNPEGPTGGRCLWATHNVWDWDRNKNEGVVLQNGYFAVHPRTKEKVDWYTDYYFPFTQAWEKKVRGVVGQEKLMFVEPIPNEFCPPTWTKENRMSNMVYAPHWYDLNALFAKAFGDFTVNVQGLSRGMFLPKALYWGQKGARDNFTTQIGTIVKHARQSLGETPVLIGECGIPMDMNKQEAFITDDFKWQARMMDAMITGLERAMVGFTLWNYNPDNTDVKGDDWNGENFSWFSRARALPPSLLDYDQTAHTLDNGGRILTSIVRPYPAKTCGIPVEMSYEMTTGAFSYEWTNSTMGMPTLLAAETEIFFPSLVAQNRELRVKGLEGGDRFVYDERRQTLYILCWDVKTPGKSHKIEVSVWPRLDDPRPEFVVNDFWGEFGGQLAGGGVVLFLLLAFVIAMLTR